MARHIGHFPLSGRLGSVVFRKNRDGSVTVANYNPVSRQRMASGDEFVRTRENFTEFACARMAAKDFRLSNPELYKNMHTRRTANLLYGRLVRIVRKGLGTRGERGLEVLANGGDIEGFQWVETDPFGGKFTGHSAITSLPSRDDVTWTIDPFNAPNVVYAPPTATHFQFVLAISVLSDYQYSVTDQEYQPVNPGINTKAAVVRSAYIPVRGAVNTPTILNAALSGVLMVPTAGLIVSTGIEFSQEVNGTHFTFAENNAMVIRTVV